MVEALCQSMRSLMESQMQEALEQAHLVLQLKCHQNTLYPLFYYLFIYLVWSMPCC